MSEPNSLDVFNQSEALENVGGSTELLTELSQTLFEEIPKLLATARAGIESGDATTVSRTLHSIKGSVTPFAAQASYKAAWKLEESSSGGNMTNASAMLNELEIELQRLVDALKKV